MTRATYLLQSQIRLLNDWGKVLRRTFEEMPYLVGSALERVDFRDVDVRVILDDDDYHVLSEQLVIEDLNLAISLWGQQVTGLPVDFQVQQMTEANVSFPGRRHPIGMEME